MLYGCPDVLWYIRTAIQHLFIYSVFFLFLCGAYFCAERSPVLCWAGGAGAGGAEAGSAAVVSAVTRRTLCNLAVKQLMLPFYPFADPAVQGRRAQVPGPQGQRTEYL